MKYGIQILMWMGIITSYLAANELKIYAVSVQVKSQTLGPMLIFSS